MMKGVRVLKKAVACILIILCMCIPVSASEPYENYTYSYEGEPETEPQAYYPYQVIDAELFGIEELSSPSDIFQADTGNLYIADTGNNRIVELDSKMKFIRVISSFDNQGVSDSFKNPNGVFVSEKNNIYIADTDNSRIVILDQDLKLIDIIGKPESALMNNDFIYKPIKIGVDYADRMFIVAQNVNEGIIELESNGDFVGFFGTVKVSANIADAFWKLIATEEQKLRMTKTVPTEYSSLDVDKDGFVYGTVSAVDNKNLDETMFVHRLNPMGTDVLKRDGSFAPMGDVKHAVDDKLIPQTSKLIDITVSHDGIYSVMDQRHGRIFTYDQYGNLLYVFGSNGDSFGQFGSCAALTAYDTEDFLVVDSKYNQILHFKPTEYGKLITQAVSLYAKRRYEESEKVWEKVLKHTSKSEIAFSGMGMNLMRNEKYKESMEYYKLANNRGLYSEAYKAYRLELINNNFTLIGILILVIAVVAAAVLIYKKIRKRRAAK